MGREIESRHDTCRMVAFKKKLHSAAAQIPWTQSYDFRIYNYNASVVLGQSGFKWETIIFILKNALCYLLNCKFLQRWRSNSRSQDWLLVNLQMTLLKILIKIPQTRFLPFLRLSKYIHMYILAK
jgi:hypothetical protein